MPVQFRLLAILQRRGMSQGELSRRSGVSMSTVNRLATDSTKRVDLATLDKLSAVLGCEPGDLLERVKQQTKPRGKRR